MAVTKTCDTEPAELRVPAERHQEGEAAPEKPETDRVRKITARAGHEKAKAERIAPCRTQPRPHREPRLSAPDFTRRARTTVLLDTHTVCWSTATGRSAPTCRPPVPRKS